MKNHSIFLVFFLLSPSLGWSNPQFNSELGSGDAALATIPYEKAFSYNPSKLSSHEGYSFVPFFWEFNFNQDAKHTFDQVRSSKHWSEVEKVSGIEDVTGRTIHLSSKLGGIFLWDQFSTALVTSIFFDSTIRGKGIPFLELHVQERADLFFSYGIPVGSGFEIGASLKPSYKFDHYIEKNVIELTNDPSFLKFQKKGHRGEGLGFDLGSSYRKHLNKDQTVTASVVIENIGDTHYKNLWEKSFTPPPPDLETHKIGLGYEKRFLNPYLNTLEVSFAYAQEKTKYYEFVSPYRLGLKLRVWDEFILSSGLYKKSPSMGLSFEKGPIQCSYVNYYEISTNITKITPVRRQGISLVLIF